MVILYPFLICTFWCADCEPNHPWDFLCFMFSSGEGSDCTTMVYGLCTPASHVKHFAILNANSLGWCDPCMKSVCLHDHSEKTWVTELQLQSCLGSQILGHLEAFCNLNSQHWHFLLDTSMHLRFNATLILEMLSFSSGFPGYPWPKKFVLRLEEAKHCREGKRKAYTSWTT